MTPKTYHPVPDRAGFGSGVPGAGSSTAGAVAGYPAITVPAGDDAGLPLGITFIGGRWTEPNLIGDAYDYEQATHIRVQPQFIPTIGDALFPGVPNP